uniref:Uncharacterized protein n=1 Tax=Anguilla anguilla TaxID=7936 RepID=A0A0E9UXJ8_ANGAN
MVSLGIAIRILPGDRVYLICVLRGCRPVQSGISGRFTPFCECE